MAKPPSQLLATWTQDAAGTEWEDLRVVLARAASQLQRPKAEIDDLLEANLLYVERHLRDDLLRHDEDGTICPFELDDDDPPYIRLSPQLVPEHLERLRLLSPDAFVKLCADVLRKLGGTSEARDSTTDGGVDFVGLEMRFAGLDVSIPAKCLMSVVGQAKHQKSHVTESDLRKFVGGAARRVHEYRVAGSIAFASPVVLAFWTSSEFHPDANAYARSLGIWLLNGRSLAKFAADQGLLPLPSRAADG